MNVTQEEFESYRLTQQEIYDESKGFVELMLPDIEDGKTEFSLDITLYDVIELHNYLMLSDLREEYSPKGIVHKYALRDMIKDIFIRYYNNYDANCSDDEVGTVTINYKIKK